MSYNPVKTKSMATSDSFLSSLFRVVSGFDAVQVVALPELSASLYSKPTRLGFPLALTVELNVADAPWPDAVRLDTELVVANGVS